MHRRRTYESWALDGRPDRAPVVAVVIPAFRTANSIRAVIERIPGLVQHVIVVDDASPDDIRAAVSTLSDPRVVLVRHETNRGVGGAMKTGFDRALELGADVVVKIDSDGQMDPALIPSLVAPLAEGGADLAKGNRFADITVIGSMPPAQAGRQPRSLLSREGGIGLLESLRSLQRIPRRSGATSCVASGANGSRTAISSRSACSASHTARGASSPTSGCTPDTATR